MNREQRPWSELQAFLRKGKLNFCVSFNTVSLSVCNNLCNFSGGKFHILHILQNYYFLKFDYYYFFKVIQRTFHGESYAVTNCTLNLPFSLDTTQLFSEICCFLLDVYHVVPQLL